MPTGRTFHAYVNPQRDMPEEAYRIHGISAGFLADKPAFGAVADRFLEFLGDGTLVIHNAPFDMGFLNAEFRWLGRPALPDSRALCTLVMARQKFPGSPCSLDMLCRRFGIDNSMREKHGALLDCELLAEVYLELIGGRQPDFALAVQSSGRAGTAGGRRPAGQRPRPLPPRLTEAEAAAHAALVDRLGEGALWRRSAADEAD
jgi:DNA polymerase-3 subunit epsilon